MLVVMASLLVIIGLFVAGVAAVQDFQRSQRHATEAEIALDRLSTEFREDAHQAELVEAEPRPFEAGLQALVFTNEDGLTRWTIADGGRTLERRWTPKDGSTGSAERFRLQGGTFAAGVRFSLAPIARPGEGSLVAIEWPTTQVGGGDGLRVEALVRGAGQGAREDQP
jgi:hypothetical protein